MSTTERPLCSAMLAVADLAIELGQTNLCQRVGCWEHRVDDHWWIAVNAHNTPTKTTTGVEVEPFGCYVEFNGLPAGLFTPFGGCIAAGKAANEDAFIRALKAATEGVAR